MFPIRLKSRTSNQYLFFLITIYLLISCLTVIIFHSPSESIERFVYIEPKRT